MGHCHARLLQCEQLIFELQHFPCCRVLQLKNELCTLQEARVAVSDTMGVETPPSLPPFPAPAGAGRRPLVTYCGKGQS